MDPSVLLLKGFFPEIVSQKFALYFNVYKAIFQEGRQT